MLKTHIPNQVADNLSTLTKLSPQHPRGAPARPPPQANTEVHNKKQLACCCSAITQESSKVHQLCLQFSLTCLKQSRGRTPRDRTLLLPSRTRRTTRAGVPRPPPKSSRSVRAQVSPPRQSNVTTFPACLPHRETIRSRCSLRKIKV